jgi:hypothetical protein
MKKIKVFCILGMHRSGTSMLSRILNIAGMSLGFDSDLFNPSDSFNEKGYWENKVVLDINKSILVKLCGDENGLILPNFQDGWERSDILEDERLKATEFVKYMNSNFTNWLIKEPRVSILLPFWKQFLPEDTKYIVSVRYPEEVSDSLVKLYGFSKSVGLVDWVYYYKCILRDTNSSNAHFVTYSELLEHTQDTLKTLFMKLDIQIDLSIKTQIDSFVESKLRHSVYESSLFVNSELASKQGTDRKKIEDLFSQEFERILALITVELVQKEDLVLSAYKSQQTLLAEIHSCEAKNDLLKEEIFEKQEELDSYKNKVRNSKLYKLTKLFKKGNEL